MSTYGRLENRGVTDLQFVDALLDLQERIGSKIDSVRVNREIGDIYNLELINLCLDYVAAERLANSEWFKK